jgi:hypothetical protein
MWPGGGKMSESYAFKVPQKSGSKRASRKSALEDEEAFGHQTCEITPRRQRESTRDQGLDAKTEDGTNL